MLLRQRALARVFVRGAQRWPVFYAFDEAIRFCVKAYNSSMSYILLGGGRERGTGPGDGACAKASSLRVLDVEERRREVQVRFTNVRRPERAAVADGLAGQAVHVVTMSNGPRARRVREATRFVGIEQ